MLYKVGLEGWCDRIGIAVAVIVVIAVDVIVGVGVVVDSVGLRVGLVDITAGVTGSAQHPCCMRRTTER